MMRELDYDDEMEGMLKNELYFAAMREVHRLERVLMTQKVRLLVSTWAMVVGFVVYFTVRD